MAPRASVLAIALFAALALGLVSLLGSVHLSIRSGGSGESVTVLKEHSRSLDQIRAALAEIQGKKLPPPHQVIEEPAGPRTELCLWTLHPGTIVGEVPEGTWKNCATEGGSCTCLDGRIRYGKGTRWVTSIGGTDLKCGTGAFGEDPMPGSLKECECETAPVRSDLSLEEAKKKCEEAAHTCKAVSCDRDGRCAPRSGNPFLAPDPEFSSYTKDCTALDDKPGGGLRGKHLIDGEHSIFVSVAAFRDRDAHNTLQDMFIKAKYPRRVFVGVVCQSYPEDPDCVPASWANCSLETGFCASDQLRQRKFHASKAEGPTHARALAASMYRGEDFFLMIDAHNRFVTHWDEVLIKNVRSCPSKKCVLSHYPQGLDNSEPDRPRPLGTSPGTSLDNFPTTSYLCGGEFHERSIIKNARAASVGLSNVPRPQPYTGAGLLFGPGRMIIEAPFDPHLPFLWDGEEFLYTARLWTWGYDFFSPCENILFHHYYRENQPRVWSEKTWSGGQGSPTQSASYRRLQYILEAPKRGKSEFMVPRDTSEYAVTRDLPKYGLGPLRTMDEYWKFARIDIRNRLGDPTVKEHNGFFCKKFRSGKGPYEVPPA